MYLERRLIHEPPSGLSPEPRAGAPYPPRAAGLALGPLRLGKAE